MNGKIDSVLDASALLALLRREPGESVVRSALPHAAIGAVNLHEVAAKLIQHGLDPAETRQLLYNLRLAVVPFDESLALEASDLVAISRSSGLSLGDRACLALARRLGVPAVTADRAWKMLRVGIPVTLIR